MTDLESDTGLAEIISNQDPKLPEEKLVKLANELAKAQLEPADVFQAFGITAAQFEQYVKTNPYFSRTYEAAVLDWHGVTSTAKRIKIKSATSLEQSLTTLHNRLNDPASALPAVVDTAKLLATLAGVGETKQPQGSGERFSISINIGIKKIEQEVPATIDVTPVPALEKPHD